MSVLVAERMWASASRVLDAWLLRTAEQRVRGYEPAQAALVRLEDVVHGIINRKHKSHRTQENSADEHNGAQFAVTEKIETACHHEQDSYKDQFWHHQGQDTQYRQYNECKRDEAG